MTLQRMIEVGKQQALTARERLIVDNIPLIAHVCRRCAMPMTDDMLQAGMVGLIRAADEYDLERGQFSTFAFLCIRNEIWRQERKGWNARKRETLLQESITAGDMPEPQYSDERAMLRDQADTALAAMLPEDRDVVIAHYMVGENYGEIAERTQRSKQRIHQRVTRGLRSAQRRLAG